MTINLPTSLSAEQRTFLQAAEALGATTPAGARPLSEWPRLSSRELDELVDRGLLREADAWSYYRFSPSRSYSDLVPRQAETPFNWGRFSKSLSFWILVILIPIIFLQFTGSR